MPPSLCREAPFKGCLYVIRRFRGTDVSDLAQDMPQHRCPHAPTPLAVYCGCARAVTPARISVVRVVPRSFTAKYLPTLRNNECTGFNASAPLDHCQAAAAAAACRRFLPCKFAP